MSKDKDVYKLTLTREQALVVKDACEILGRLKLGQFNIIVEKLLPASGINPNEYYNRKENATDALNLAACIVLGRNVHGLAQVSRDDVCYRAFGVHDAIRYAIAWKEHPQGGYQTCFDQPGQYKDDPIPICTITNYE